MDPIKKNLSKFVPLNVGLFIVPCHAAWFRMNCVYLQHLDFRRIRKAPSCYDPQNLHLFMSLNISFVLRIYHLLLIIKCCHYSGTIVHYSEL